MSYVFPPAPVVSVPVVGSGERFPVHRIYCVGRNYEEHAKEMGFTGREPPSSSSSLRMPSWSSTRAKPGNCPTPA